MLSSIEADLFPSLSPPLLPPLPLFSRTSHPTTDGMNSTVGPLSYRQDQDGFQKPFSEKTAELLDGEVRKMVNMAHERTTKLLTEKRAEVEKVAQLLLAREVLSRFVLPLLLPSLPLPPSPSSLIADPATSPTATI